MPANHTADRRKAGGQTAASWSRRVFASHGWLEEIPDEGILEDLPDLDLERSGGG